MRFEDMLEYWRSHPTVKFKREIWETGKYVKRTAGDLIVRETKEYNPPAVFTDDDYNATDWTVTT